MFLPHFVEKRKLHLLMAQKSAIPIRHSAFNVIFVINLNISFQVYFQSDFGYFIVISDAVLAGIRPAYSTLLPTDAWSIIRASRQLTLPSLLTSETFFCASVRVLFPTLC